MKHVVSFSGGRTSAYLVYLMEQKRKIETWDVDYVFMDTGAEHPGTYDFIERCAKEFGINLTCLKAVINPRLGVGPTYQVIDIADIGWDLSMFSAISKKHGAPYCPGGEHCTQHLKTIPYQKYCRDKYGKGNYTTWCGIRVDELKRLKPKDGYKYLAEISSMTKNDILGWWSQQNFDLDIDEWDGNCVFCIKKPINRVALAALTNPNLANEFDSMLQSNDKNEKLKGAIYRGKLTLDGIASFYDGYDAEQIKSTMRVRKGCAISDGESCEVFGCQGDLFDDN